MGDILNPPKAQRTTPKCPPSSHLSYLGISSPPLEGQLPCHLPPLQQTDIGTSRPCPCSDLRGQSTTMHCVLLISPTWDQQSVTSSLAMLWQLTLMDKTPVIAHHQPLPIWDRLWEIHNSQHADWNSTCFSAKETQHTVWFQQWWWGLQLETMGHVRASRLPFHLWMLSA